VAITGGEPMHQVDEVNALIAALLAAPGSGALSVKAPDPLARGTGKGSGAQRHKAPDPGSPDPAANNRAPGRRVLIETNGAHAIDALDPRAIRIVDVKTPGSGMAGRVCWRNLDLVRPEDEVKFVLTGRPDYEWAKEVVERHDLAARTTVLFGPAVPQLAPRDLAEWILADALPVRLNLQIHKFLGLR
jgi:organic radical activating enzyme